MSRITSALNNLLTGKGFYLALALCLVGSALAAFLGAGGVRGEIAEENRRLAEELSAPASPAPAPHLISKSTPPAKASEAPKPQTPAVPAAAPAEPTPVKKVESAAPAAVRASWFWPVAGALIGEFSGDELVKNVTLDQWQTHNGVDIQAPAGAKVLAAADGVVERVFVDPLWGTVVELGHNGGLTSVYRGLGEPVSLAVGTKVKGNTPIGTLGEIPCECLLSSHLHFELVQGGKRIDPTVVLP